MPDLKVIIGGRNFNISCNPGEEKAAQESANLLNLEAELLHNQLGRLPEDKMLLLSGLLLGDQIRALKHHQCVLEESLKATQTKLDEVSSKLDGHGGEGGSLLSTPDDDIARKLEENLALKELKVVSDMLDGLIEQTNSDYTDYDSEKNMSLPEDDGQDSFL